MSDKVKIVSFTPLTLYTDAEDGRYASLTWSIRMGYPRLSVYTDNNRDKSAEFSHDKLITAPMNAVSVNMFLDRLNSVIAADKEVKYSIKCYNTKYVNNEPTNDISLQATIIVGKDKDGVVYLAAIHADKKKVRFKLLPNTKWHKFTNDKGDDIEDEGVLSDLYAKAYSKRLAVLMDKFLVDDSAIKFTERKGGNTAFKADPTKEENIF